MLTYMEIGCSSFESTPGGSLWAGECILYIQMYKKNHNELESHLISNNNRRSLLDPRQILWVGMFVSELTICASVVHIQVIHWSPGCNRNQTYTKIMFDQHAQTPSISQIPYKQNFSVVHPISPQSPLLSALIFILPLFFLCFLEKEFVTIYWLGVYWVHSRDWP